MEYPAPERKNRSILVSEGLWNLTQQKSGQVILLRSAFGIDFFNQALSRLYFWRLDKNNNHVQKRKKVQTL